MKVLGFAGYSGSGKTTLIEQLIPRFRRQGLRVSLIKHAHHAFDIDKPGKDSFRHRQAGASEVMLVSSRRWALLRELRDEMEPSLEEQIERMSSCDLLLVEGFKLSSIPKIEIYRPALGKPRLGDTAKNIIALASDTKIANARTDELPRLDLNDPNEIAGFMLDFLQIHRSKLADHAQGIFGAGPCMRAALQTPDWNCAPRP